MYSIYIYIYIYTVECWRSPDFESLVNAVDGVLYVLS
jgi:hypothetical protein